MQQCDVLLCDVFLSEASQTKEHPQKSYHFQFFLVYFVFTKIVSHSAHPMILMLEIKAQDAWHVCYQWIKRHHSNHFVFKVL